MEQLKNLLQFNPSGDSEVQTIMDGRFTIPQVVTLIVGLLIIIIILLMFKGLVRKLVTLGVIVVVLIQFGIASPEQLGDVASQVKAKGVAYYETYDKLSKSIKIKGDKIKIKLGDDWVDISEIQSIITSGEEFITVVYNNNSYPIDDKAIIDLLHEFK